MATFIAVLCVVAIVVCLPMVVLKPKWVFYTFLFFVTFSSIFGGYINAAGGLGTPRIWTPADVFAWMTLVAAIFVPRERQYTSGAIGKCFIVIALITALSLVQGFLLYTYTAFTYSRVAHFVAAMLFGLRYFTNYSRVNGFLKFVAVLLLVMFVFHVLIRFAIFTPPSAETEFQTQLGGERGAQSLVPLLYLALTSIAIGRLVSKVGSSFMSLLVLLIGVSGVLLSETRAEYGALGILAAASLLFVKGRAKALIAFSLAGLIAVGVAAAIGYDPLARFRAGPTGGTGEIVIPKIIEKGEWRTEEYSIIVSSYQQASFLILTGRGIGAMHPAPAGEAPMVGFYHSEYLGWLDRCGLIGLVAMIILMLSCLAQSFTLSRSDVPYLRSYGITCFLLMASLMADGFFHPIFSNHRGASLLICFTAIIANWRDIYQSFYQEPEVLQVDAYQDLAYA
jgi:hypothetical protein